MPSGTAGALCQGQRHAHLRSQANRGFQGYESPSSQAHNRTVLSSPAVASSRPSGLNATARLTGGCWSGWRPSGAGW